MADAVHAAFVVPPQGVPSVVVVVACVCWYTNAPVAATHCASTKASAWTYHSRSARLPVGTDGHQRATRGLEALALGAGVTVARARTSGAS